MKRFVSKKQFRIIAGSIKEVDICSGRIEYPYEHLADLETGDTVDLLSLPLEFLISYSIKNKDKNLTDLLTFKRILCDLGSMIINDIHTAEKIVGVKRILFPKSFINVKKLLIDKKDLLKNCDVRFKPIDVYCYINEIFMGLYQTFLLHEKTSFKICIPVDHKNNCSEDKITYYRYFENSPAVYKIIDSVSKNTISIIRKIETMLSEFGGVPNIKTMK